MPSIMPDADHTKAFREFVRILRTAPTLTATVKDWQVFDDFHADDPPAGAACPIVHPPAGAACPIVRLTIDGSGEGCTRVEVHYPLSSTMMPLGISVETWVEGFNATNSLNLSGKIHDVIFPQDEAVRAAIWERWIAPECGGVQDVQVVRAVHPPGLAAYRDGMTYARGLYRLDMTVFT